MITQLSFIEDVRDTLQCLNPQAVIASVAAGQAWNDRRDVPDVVAYRDLAHAPEQTLRLIRDRVQSGRMTGQVHKMPVAKADPSKSDQAMRRACVLDPITEIAFRCHLSACIDNVEAQARSIGDDVVLAGRVRAGDTPAGWSQVEPSYLLDRRGAAIVDHLDASTFFAVGQADVKNCYSSFTSSTVSDGMSDCGIPDHIVDPVRRLLLELPELWQYKGLPIGPEWAPVLANATMFAVDWQLQSAGIRHQRWIDDFIFVFHGFGWSQARRIFEAALHERGLEPNPLKYRYDKNRDRILTNFVDPRIEDIRRAESDADRVDAARRLFADAVDIGGPHRPRRVKFALGALSRYGCTDAVGALMANPDLLAVAPRHTARYLKRMIIDGAVDVDWVVDRATTLRSERDAIGQLHLLRICSQVGDAWSDDHATAFLACADDTTAPSPIRSWAAIAYGRTSTCSSRHAADRVEDSGDIHLQRAWTLTLADRPRSRKTRRAARRIQHAYPTCGPAATFVLDGA